MSQTSLDAALDRSERALLRIERSLSAHGSRKGRDDALRAKVVAVVEELDGLIRQAGAH